MIENMCFGAILCIGLLSVAFGMPAQKGPCAMAGHRNGSCQGGSTKCMVAVMGEKRCYCNEKCFFYDDCCSDIYDIKCFAETCKGVGLNPGGCPWSNTSCSTGRCYCDQLCYRFGDCCEDVPSSRTGDYVSRNPYSKLMNAETLSRQLLEAQIMRDNWHDSEKILHDLLIQEYNDERRAADILKQRLMESQERRLTMN